MGNIKPCLSAILFVNLLKNNACTLAEIIKEELGKSGIETVIYSFEGKPGKPPEGKWDIAFTLGGDGTVLYAARCLAHLEVPIIPINLGSLGFLSEVNVDDWLDVFTRWRSGEINPSKRCMFNVSVLRDSKIVMENTSLNDAVISCTGMAKLIRLNVKLFNTVDIAVKSKNELNSIYDQEGGTALGSYRCDGLILSTPTGSTAYSMAAGGPILDPEMEAVIINPICPFSLSNRPFVLTSHQVITVTVEKKQHKHDFSSGVLLTIDGQDIFNLECDDRVMINHSPFNALLIYPGKFAYYTALRRKLFWSGEDTN